MLGRTGTLVRKHRRRSSCGLLKPPEISRRGSAPTVLVPTPPTFLTVPAGGEGGLHPNHNRSPCKSVSFTLDARRFSEVYPRKVSFSKVSQCKLYDTEINVSYYESAVPQAERNIK